LATLSGQKILVGVTGGIAAYKAAELVRELRTRDADVRVVMTPGAQEFVSALTFQALTGQPVYRELFDLEEESAMGHITLARWPDQIVIAPASANFMARLAHGMADDLLSTLCLASRAPITLTPAMNQVMWLNPATQDNVAVLKARGHRFLGPAEGVQACGETGPGRMLEPRQIADHIESGATQGALSGLKVLITAGPTREPIDPVRYLTNRSSGRMGYAIAEAARTEGAEVILVSGPTALPAPCGVVRQNVETAREMHDAVMQAVGQTDIFIGTAAVADYAPEPLAQKLKKTTAELHLALQKTPDILATVAARKDRPFTVGFAAETEALETYARRKLVEKDLDLIAANQVGQGLGFDTEDNALLVLWPEGQKQLSRAPKRLLANQLISLIADHYHAKHPAQNS
jgi:phosphopantothenoylcysteine decarboxylase / phosphopantothenate---cysteine ligase